MRWGKKKEQRPVYIENHKPKNATYKIVLGQDLKVGDIIVHNHERCLITSVSLGGGSGSFDFGGYVPVYAERLTGQLGFLSVDFWTFQTCPVIVEVSDEGVDK
jgi:hypothetical protein